jgi:DNA-binding XRE family transcriptional regulator
MYGFLLLMRAKYLESASSLPQDDAIIFFLIFPCIRPVNFRDEKLLGRFGAQLKTLRIKKKITQEELAFQSNLSLSQIDRIETGKINPTLCTLQKISETLNIKMKDLVDF